MKRLSLAVILIAGSASSQVPMQMPMPMIADWSYAGTVSQQIFTNSLSEIMLKQTLERSTTDDQADGSPTSNSLVEAKSARPVQLGFSPSLKRRQANYASFVERSRKIDPAGAGQLAETLKMDPVAMMKPELAKVGLSVDDVADAYTVYWVEAWQAVHGISGASSRATAQAVRRQAADAIAATPEFATATPAQKQEFAEAMLVQALLIGAAKEQAGGDRAKLRQVSAAVEKGARASGFDLRAVTLSEEGFGPARKTGAADPAPGAEPQALAATEDASSRPSYGFLAAAGGAGLGAAFLMGKAMGRR